jgi:negative regulator of sigma E activity
MMKCDDCLNLLSEYIDGEASKPEAASVSAHLIACANCANEFEALTAEQEIYARYDRELEVSPAMWHAIAARTLAEHRPGQKTSWRASFAGLFAIPRFGFAFSGAMAAVIIAVVVGVMYLRTQPQPNSVTPDRLVAQGKPGLTSVSGTSNVPPPVASDSPDTEIVVRRKTPKQKNRTERADDPGVLFPDVAYSPMTVRDTAEHIRQAENLLRSIRSLQESDDDVEIDVSYEKAMSQRLLNENVVLRRDAETAGKFPTKELLGDLEPFLIDIANLPDKTTPDKLRAIKDRARKTEIVAALVSY